MIGVLWAYKFQCWWITCDGVTHQIHQVCLFKKVIRVRCHRPLTKQEPLFKSGIFSNKMWRCSCDRTSWWSIRVSVSQVIEKHYGRSLEVWTERAAVLSENGTDEGEFSEAGQHPSVIMYWSLSVSIFSIGGMLSSFLVGYVGDLRGRWARRDKIMRTYLCEDESLTEE